MVSDTLSPLDAEEQLASEKVRDTAAQVKHGSFKAQSGTCAWLIKACSKLFTGAGMRIF